MRTFSITQIAEMSSLTIGQIEQAFSRHELSVRGKVGKNRAREFLAEDAFSFCIIGEMRKLGIDWKRIVGSTAHPWPVADVLDGNQFFLLTPMSDGYLDFSVTTASKILRNLRAYKASGAILIDGGAIARRIEAFAKRTKPAPPGDVEWART